MTVFDIILFTIIGILGVVCIGGLIYSEFIEPLRAKLALAEHFPMYESERDTYIENSKGLDDKRHKLEKLQDAIDRLTTETKYLTGIDLVIVKGAIEKLKVEYAEVKTDYELSKMNFENYSKMFYTLYPFAYPYDKYDDTDPLPRKEILYKNIKNSLDK